MQYSVGTVLASVGKTAEAIPFLESSEAVLSGKEKEAVAALLAQCRQDASASGTPAMERLLQRLSQTLTLQTTAMNLIAQKLISIEYQVTVLNHAIQS
jgi:hypothetical protein